MPCRHTHGSEGFGPEAPATLYNDIDLNAFIPSSQTEFESLKEYHSKGRTSRKQYENLMGDNQQQNYGSNMSGGKTSKATVMPANRKHVSTMMAEKTAKVIASTAKHIKNKNKINPEDYGS